MIDNHKLFTAKILIIDDEEISNRLLKGILKNAGYKNIITSTDSREARSLYEEIQPDLMILDLHMPHMNGFEVMGNLKGSNNGKYLPILIISSDDDQQVRFKALQSGGKDFLHKPYDRVEVAIRIRNLIEVRMLHNEVIDQNKILEIKVAERTKDLYDSQLELIHKLSRAIEFRDSETGMHILRMSQYSACLAEAVGLNKKECELILTASPLHDIGKIGIPDRILCKPDKLNAEEWEIMKTHTIIGAEMLSGSKSEFLKVGQEIALAHHEKWDGTGYPKRLKKEQIPIVGRICGLCDVFDALSTKRLYKRAWSEKEAFEEIKAKKGTHFDPKIVDIFIKIFPEIIKIKKEHEDPDLF